MKNKGTAILLALFLGGAGLHKFYLGKSLQGILYFLFIWTFVPSVLALIDLIIYICTSENDWNEKYNKAFLKA